MLKIFDRKMDYACLLAFPNFLYWTLGHYFDNWLMPPPGVPFIRWLSTIAEILGNYLDIRVAARSLFTSAALHLWKEKFGESQTSFPTLQNVRDHIAEFRYHPLSHLARYRETLLNRLDGILTIYGENICSIRRLNWNEYINSNWAISLDGIPTDYQNLFITVTIAKIISFSMTRNLRSQNLKILFVFDEASTMFKKWHESGEHTYLLTDYLAKSREFGIGFIIGTQTLSNLADSVIANTGVKILVGGSGIGSDYDLFASATGLIREQKEFLKQRTLPGMACVKDPRYPHPFIMEVPKIV
jgi:hypothetical protein